MKLRALQLLPLLFLAACSLEQKVVQRPAILDGTQALAKQAPVGLQNFRQALATREAAVGIKAPASVLDSIAGLLSADGDSQGASGPMLVAQGTFGFRFCSVVVNREGLIPSVSRRYFKSADLSSPASRLSPAARSEAVQDLFKLALDRAPSPQEAAAIDTALVEGEASAPTGANGTATTIPSSPASHALNLACSAVFASPDAITQ